MYNVNNTKMPVTSSMKDYYYKVNKITKGLSNVKLLYDEFNTMYETKNFSSLPWYNMEIKEIVDYILKTQTNNQTICGYINCLIIIYANEKDKHKYVRDIYFEHKKEIDETRKQNNIETYEIVSLEENDIDQAYEQLKDVKSKLLFALYIYLPPRRLDYRHMKYVKVEPENEKENYLIHNDDGTFTLIFNEYKTKNKYKKQKFIVDHPKVCKALVIYLLKTQMTYDNYLFPSNTGTKLTASPFGVLLSIVFTNAFNKYVTLNDIRHSWANKLNKDLPNLNVNDIEKITTMMGHSISESLKYRKI